MWWKDSIKEIIQFSLICLVMWRFKNDVAKEVVKRMKNIEEE